MSNVNVIVGIVTYNPNPTRFSMNISKVANQFSNIVIVDNFSNNYEEIEHIVKRFPNIKIIKNNKNEGIALALNIIGKEAVRGNYDWFLTLDQDSIICDNYFLNFINFKKNRDIGIVCPCVNEKCLKKSENNFIEVASAITSGCFFKTKVWIKINGFWEYLFIDEVDHEYCYLMRSKGYKIVRLKSISINHIIGDPKIKKILFHTFHPSNHSSFRKFYITRNSIIIGYLYPKEKYPSKNRKLKIFRMIISTILCEEKKIPKVKAIFEGIIAGNKWISKRKKLNVLDNDKYREKKS